MKISLVVLTLCVLSVRAAPSQVKETSPAISLRDYSTLNKEVNPFIINGSPAAPGQFPWQCFLTLRVGTSLFVCGSTLINPTTVLTAAHCLYGVLLFEVACGSLYLTLPDLNRQTRLSIDGRMHPNYNSQTLNNDVGIVIYPQPMTSTDLIRPIRLATSDEFLDAGVSVRASGWGITSDDSEWVSEELNFVDVTTISNAQCALVYGSNTIVSSSVCVVGTGPPGNVGNTCGGDSGGALVLFENGEYVQHGVISFMHPTGCGTGNPSGSVRTQSVRAWIESQITLP